MAGQSPAGTVRLHETFASGAGLGGGLEKIQAQGEVFNLTNVGDFAGAYRQSSGAPGVATSGATDLWLKNRAGVVMHLTGSQSGGMLSLGGEEILIRIQQ